MQIQIKINVSLLQLVKKEHLLKIIQHDAKLSIKLCKFISDVIMQWET